MTIFATGGGEVTTRSSPTSERAPGVVTNVRASKDVSANADAAAASATTAAARQTASFDIGPPGCGKMPPPTLWEGETAVIPSATLERGHAPPSPHRHAHGRQPRRAFCGDGPDTRPNTDAGRRLLASSGVHRSRSRRSQRRLRAAADRLVLDPR